MGNGLSTNEVLESRKKYGSNKIIYEKQNSFFKLLLESLGDPIIKILLIALGIKIIFLIKDFDWYETIGILIAIFIASFISSISEYGSEQTFIKMQEEASKLKCKVLRNNIIKEIYIDDVVVNDIVLISTGDMIVADGDLIDGHLTVDESTINGEFKESYKHTYKNKILYRGTTVLSGEGKMLVKSVGVSTSYGKIYKSLENKGIESPLKLRLRKLANIISKIGYLGAFLVFISYLFKVIVINNNFNSILMLKTLNNSSFLFSNILYALTLSVTIIVVAVPEGLPMMITLVLATNMKKMLKSNVLVRKLLGIETAGNINVLFTDKTGTLTYGNLVVDCFIDNNFKKFKSIKEIKDKKYRDIVIKSLIYNNSSIYEDNKAIGGNSTDRALCNFIRINNKNIKRSSFVPFDSKKKYSSCICDGVKYIKGAYELLLPKCSFFYNELGVKSSLLNKDKIEKRIVLYENLGYRVLMCVCSEDLSFKNLILVGFVLIKDKVREDAIEGVSLVKSAGIDTIMITGDNLETAISIGKEAGIVSNINDLAITSEDLNKMSDSEVKTIIPRLKILARALPEDKLRLVKLSQELGKVVGMTGDGVNDAPALKQADVGFSMGSGTEITKESSDIIILDDNFLSITKAILYGRTIFKNIRKFIIFQLTVNLCAISLSIIGPFIGIDTPVTVIQMLWINMIMDTFAGVAFSYEAPRVEYMKETPKTKNEPIINSYMLGEILFTGIYSSFLCILFLKVPYFKQMFRISPDNIYFMTAFFGLFIFIGIFNAFNARTSRINLFANLFQNRIFILIIIFIVLVQTILIYFGGSLFRTAGLTIKEFIVMLFISFSVIPIDLLRKIFLKKKKKSVGV